jgi:hypothetical protein
MEVKRKIILVKKHGRKSIGKLETDYSEKIKKSFETFYGKRYSKKRIGEKIKKKNNSRKKHEKNTEN